MILELTCACGKRWEYLASEAGMEMDAPCCGARIKLPVPVGKLIVPPTETIPAPPVSACKKLSIWPAIRRLIWVFLQRLAQFFILLMCALGVILAIAITFSVNPYIGCALIHLFLLYWVIRLAVTHALKGKK